VLILLLALAACGRPGAPRAVHRLPGPDDLPDEAAFLAEIDRSRGTRDGFEVIRDPRLVPAAADHGIADDERVLGLDLGAVQVAYPTRLLDFHEIVEHTVAGLDLLACW